MITYIPEPYWCMEGFVIEAGRYPTRLVEAGGDGEACETQVFTILGWATLLEPSDGVNPTVGPGVFTTGHSA